MLKGEKIKILAPQSGIIFAIKIIKSKAKVVPDWGNSNVSLKAGF